MLAGKSALIAGSLGGIDFATAKALAAQGCNVMPNGFAATIDAHRAELRELGVGAACHGADLRDPAARILRPVQQAAASFVELLRAVWTTEPTIALHGALRSLFNHSRSAFGQRISGYPLTARDRSDYILGPAIA